MGTSGAHGSVPAVEAHRRRAIRRRLGVLVAVVVVVLQMQAPTPAPAQVGGAYQARVCATLQGIQAAFGDNVFVRQALIPFLARYGCGPALPPPATTVPGSTTTSVHLDCMLPGGGIGPCPTTTFTTFAPTTLPPGATTVPPPSTTLPPCPTSTSSTMFPSTTIPSCQG